MLNLVQLQERLKDVPMQALMQYANGANPQIPPFLALGELNRRKKMQESAAAEQAKEMAGAPSIKEQIEQATGLMALQGSRQRQASQQQASASANQLMPAPNTMTSEPAQMASGGSVDDVMPRDYQAGGQISPDLAKRLMMLKAMKGRQGLSRLPMKNNMFKRADYAGGGIVAFSSGGSTFDDFISDSPVYEGTKEKATKDEIAVMSLPQLQEYYRSGYIPEDVKAAAASRKSGKPEPRVVAAPEPSRRDEEPRPRAAAAAAGLPAIIEKFLKLDPEKMAVYQAPERKTAEEYKKERQGLNAIFGVSEDPYAELKKRYSDIEAEDKRTRAAQPMEQLTRFLTGIAQSRRGAGFGEAGAAGVTAVGELRAQQQALNRKLDLDMAGLRSVIAEREDARARGDRDGFLALDKEAKEAAKAIEKDKINLMQSQAQLLNQSRQVGASEMQAMAAMMGASGRDEKSKELLVRSALDRLEKDREYIILKLSSKPEDKVKADRMRQDAIREALSGYANTGSSSGAKEYRKYDAQGNPVQ